VLEEKQFPTHIKPVIAGDDTTLARNQSRPVSHGSSRPNPPHQTKVTPNTEVPEPTSFYYDVAFDIFFNHGLGAKRRTA